HAAAFDGLQACQPREGYTLTRSLFRAQEPTIDRSIYGASARSVRWLLEGLELSERVEALIGQGVSASTLTISHRECECANGFLRIAQHNPIHSVPWHCFHKSRSGIGRQRVDVPLCRYVHPNHRPPARECRWLTEE